jgi:hypothetical protein
MKTYFLWRAAGSYPRDVISEARPEFDCSPVLKEGAPSEPERQKTLPMSEWHELSTAATWRDAKADFQRRRLLIHGL